MNKEQYPTPPSIAVLRHELGISVQEAKRLQALPRQRRYQAIRKLRGLCVGCGKEKLVSTSLGENCLRKQRERMRKKTGAKKRYETIYSTAKSSR